MNFEAMGLQRTTLSEWLLTEIALVGSNTWKKNTNDWLSNVKTNHWFGKNHSEHTKINFLGCQKNQNWFFGCPKIPKKKFLGCQKIWKKYTRVLKIPKYSYLGWSKIQKYFSFTCMGPGMSLQIKGVIEAFTTKGTEIPLGITVTLHVPIQKPLQAEDFRAQAALKLGRVAFRSGWRQLDLRNLYLWIGAQRIFDSMPTIDEFNGCIRWNTQLQWKNHMVKKWNQLTLNLLDDWLSHVSHSWQSILKSS